MLSQARRAVERGAGHPEELARICQQARWSRRYSLWAESGLSVPDFPPPTGPGHARVHYDPLSRSLALAATSLRRSTARTIRISS